jgi:molecular chaperone DnaJ
LSKRDYYEILGVERSTSKDEIKKAYRKMALKYHPDKNDGDPAAEDKFKEAAEAYDVLGDDNKRQQYDQFGHNAFQGGAAGPQGFGSMDDIFSAFGDIFGSGGGGSGGIFDSFFGGGRQSRSQAGRNVRADVSITLTEAANGITKELDVEMEETCDDCEGSGAAEGSSPSTCGHCGGSGQMQVARGFFAIRTTCSECRGAGQVITNPCGTCRGRGRKPTRKKYDVAIPPGVDTGMKLRITGAGEPSPDGGPKGDLYCFIEVEPHDFFQRSGDDLICNCNITYPQAVLGDSIKINTLEGETELNIPEGSTHGSSVKLRGKGMPNLEGAGNGDQVVYLSIDVPNRVNKEEKELLKQLAEIQNIKLKSSKKGLLSKLRDIL